jgi:hypothetical protein
LLIKLKAHHALQGVCEEIFPISYSDKTRSLAIYAPSIEDLAQDDSICAEWIKGAALGH